MFLLLSLVSLLGCWEKRIDPNYEFEYDTIVTEIPVNLEKINTVYDDYNSALPYPGTGLGLYFSSNRNSAGENFDIVYKSLGITYHERDDVLNINYTNNEYPKYTATLLPIINSDFDELGPLFYFGEDIYEYFLYSNNENGNFDINYVYSKKSDFGTYNAQEIISEPFPLTSINTEYDDLYPCLTSDKSELIFCSNRDNEVFNIYDAAFSEDEMLTKEIDSTQITEAIFNDVLSSQSNDKCPSIVDDILIFTSDREGGYGGFDLYYSKYKNGEWTHPENLGEDVNTMYDEYRPIIVPFVDHIGIMIIFSSNRPEGKGGFDLYAVRTFEMGNN